VGFEDDGSQCEIHHHGGRRRLRHRGLRVGSSGVPFFIIALGFFALSWVERSPLLAGISTTFFGGALLANLYNMKNMFYRTVVYNAQAGEWQSAFANFLLPGLILVVGGVVALFRGRRRRL
jgi:hypothetical protein